MIPTAFRIHDFKSIKDSGVCEMSADRITVIAGQNESGKTAILTALRDFDLEPGAKPKTADYWPDHAAEGVRPRVAVCFKFEVDEVDDLLVDEDFVVPKVVEEALRATDKLWITRDLETGHYEFEDRFTQLWKKHGSQLIVEQGAGSTPTAESTLADLRDPDAPSRVPKPPHEIGGVLRQYWPQFLYFDTFGNELPRSTSLSELVPPPKPEAPEPAPTTTSLLANAMLLAAAAGNPTTPGFSAPAAGAAQKAHAKKIPEAVLDFIALSGIDLKYLSGIATDDKRIDNYLRSKSASITGDFLSYWNQNVNKEQTLQLRVVGRRSARGELNLNFYVFDGADHYPEQRSKGFLWFLSFYLRLTASQVRNPDRNCVLLIDEPGSYLHARAQKDVLHLFEERLIGRDHIIYSTHSPFLIPANRLHRLRIAMNLPSGGSQVFDRLTHPSITGKAYSDTMSPILTAVGIDIREGLKFAREHNVIVEGMSDYLYLMAWASRLKIDFASRCNVFPCMGAMSTAMLATLFIGWGLDFIVLLDRDQQGDAARKKLVNELGIEGKRVIQPKNAAGIEDMFSPEDFKNLVCAYDPSLTVGQGETPTRFIKQRGIDKILLARRYAELKLDLTKKTSQGITNLFAELMISWKEASGEVDASAVEIHTAP